MIFLMMLFMVLLPMLMIQLSILNVIRHPTCGSNLNWLLNLNLIYETLWTGSLLEEKSSFKMLHLTFSSKLDWVSYNISIAKTASKKLGTLIHSMKFLSPEVAMYLYKSTICPYME